MSEATSTREPAPITQRHYQAIGGLALAAIFLIQLQQASGLHEATLIANLLMLLLGALGLLYRIRLSPMFVLIIIGLPILLEQYNLNQFDLNLRSGRTLDVADMLLCVATLTYLIAQFRLHGLFFGVLPADPRISKETAARSQSSLSAAELFALIVPVPACALLAQLAWILLRQHWTLIELPPNWKQFMVIGWTLLLALFLAGHAFRYWRRLQMDRTSALLLLQDILWRETRGEQRSINRWIVWRRLRDRKS